MSRGFSGKTQDSILGTVWMEAHAVDDREAFCTLCGHKGVTLSARVSCTKTVQDWKTFICQACQPRFGRSAHRWFLAGTDFLRRRIRQDS